jgi:hypothetical protein
MPAVTVGCEPKYFSQFALAKRVKSLISARLAEP